MKRESGQQLAAKGNGRAQSSNTKDLLLSFIRKLISRPLKNCVGFDDFVGQEPRLKDKLTNAPFRHFSEGKFLLSSEILPISDCHYPEFARGSSREPTAAVPLSHPSVPVLPQRVLTLWKPGRVVVDIREADVDRGRSC